MDDMVFDPATGLKDTAVFPTTPASGVAARAQLQELHDQTRDFINSTIIPAVELGGIEPGHVVGARFERTTNQTLHQAPPVHITFTAYPYNPDSAEAAQGATATRMYVTYDGVYTLSGQVVFENFTPEGADNVYTLNIVKNGSNIYTKQVTYGDGEDAPNFSIEFILDNYELVAGDYLELAVLFSSEPQAPGALTSAILSMRRNVV